MTKFQQAVKAAYEGTLQAPVITMGTAKIDPLRYQLAVHRGLLRLTAAGLKVRGFRLADVKAYYGYKGRSAAEVLQEHLALMADFDETRSAYIRALNAYIEHGCESEE